MSAELPPPGSPPSGRQPPPEPPDAPDVAEPADPTTDLGDAIAVRSSGESRRLHDWRLVLESLGLRHRAQPRIDGGATLEVAVHDVGSALRELDEFDAEEAELAAHRAAVAESSLRGDGLLAGLTVAAAILLAHAHTGPRVSGHSWFTAGAATARAIGEGAWWRAVTALGLHADAGHVFGNAVSGAVLVTALGDVVGPGAALLLVVLSGALGNLANGLLRGPPHAAIGASTAVFGSLGILAGLAALRRWRGTAPQRGARWLQGAWVPVGAALGLLAAMGASEETDVLAHFFGFLSGLGLGLVAPSLARTGPVAQFLMAAAAVGLIAASWLLALGG